MSFTYRRTSLKLLAEPYATTETVTALYRTCIESVVHKTLNLLIICRTIQFRFTKNIRNHKPVENLSFDEKYTEDCEILNFEDCEILNFEDLEILNFYC